MVNFCKISATVLLLGIPASYGASNDIVISMPTGMKDLEGLRFESFRRFEYGMNFVFARKDGKWRMTVTLLNSDTPKDRNPAVADVHELMSSQPQSLNPIKHISKLSSMKDLDGETWHFFTAVSPGEPPADGKAWEPDPTPVMWAEGRRADYRVQLYVADKRENASPKDLGQMAEGLIHAVIKSMGPPAKRVPASQAR